MTRKVEFVFKTAFETPEEDEKEALYEIEYQAANVGEGMDTVEIFIDGVSKGEQPMKNLLRRVNRRMS